MYISVRFSTRAAGVNSTRNTKNATKIAKRMTLIVLTDFCCWVPITVMGILALTDTVTIPGSVYAWTAVFILPVNSAMNPILYTISVIKVKKTPPRQSELSTKSETMKISNRLETVSALQKAMQMTPLVPNDLLTSSLERVEQLKRNIKVQHGKLTVKEVHVIAVGIAKSLDFLHEYKIVHGRVSENSIVLRIDAQGNICRAFLSDMSRSQFIVKDTKIPYAQDMKNFGSLISQLMERVLE
ncbi:uncharacterized protein [Ptychodera flava]|uniref:uncharacterized protein n=1 Tax=Ptychodera flava TaxID=63121 RepID=UPI00396AB0D0